MRRRESSCTPQGLALEKVSNMRKGLVPGNAQVQCSRLWEGPPRTLACSDTWRVRGHNWLFCDSLASPSPHSAPDSAYWLAPHVFSWLVKIFPVVKVFYVQVGGAVTAP